VTTEEFVSVLNDQISNVRGVLDVKAIEYAPVDRLSNFKQAAHLQKISMPQAVVSFMAKHTVSIFDMVRTGKPYPIEVWDEKITDHINYLILLKAALLENAKKENDA